MGAHSLGRTRKSNSGYEGSWTPTRENVFGNEFHRVLHDDIGLFHNEVCFHIIVLFLYVIISFALNTIFTSLCANLKNLVIGESETGRRWL